MQRVSECVCVWDHDHWHAVTLRSHWPLAHLRKTTTSLAIWLTVAGVPEKVDNRKDMNCALFQVPKIDSSNILLVSEVPWFTDSSNVLQSRNPLVSEVLWFTYWGLQNTSSLSVSSHQVSDYQAAPLSVLLGHCLFLTILIFHGVQEELLRHPNDSTGEVGIVGHPLADLNPLRWVEVAGQDGEHIIVFSLTT